nr:hypothetical protein [Tanacetum cinerariifolium]
MHLSYPPPSSDPPNWASRVHVCSHGGLIPLYSAWISTLGNHGGLLMSITTLCLKVIVVYLGCVLRCLIIKGESYLYLGRASRVCVCSHGGRYLFIRYAFQHMVALELSEKNRSGEGSVDACPNACEMWKSIERLKQGESINVQGFETDLYWELRKFTSRDGESLESYYLRAERIARVANPLALVAQQQPVYHPQTHPNHYTQNSSTKLQHAATRNKGKAIDKEIDKHIALISLSFKIIYKPTNNNLRTSSNTSRANQDNSPRINKSTGECQKPKQIKDAAYHREKMLLSKQEEAGIQLNAEQADWRDDTDDDELEDQELEAHYMYMAQIQEVSPDIAVSGPILDTEPLQKNDDNNDLDNERELLASLIEKLKCEIDESKNRNKFLETSNKHQNEVNEIRAERIARVANPLALVAQQQPVYHPQTHPNHYTQNSSTKLQHAATRNKGKAIVNSPQPIYD